MNYAHQVDEVKEYEIIVFDVDFFVYSNVQHVPQHGRVVTQHRLTCMYVVTLNFNNYVVPLPWSTEIQLPYLARAAKVFSKEGFSGLGRFEQIFVQIL
jgi:hypothetical protein